MTKPNALHHLALSTGDIKTQIEFFTDVLGMELAALYWMHGLSGAWHGFLRLNENCAIAFVFMEQNLKAKPISGVTHSGGNEGYSAPGTMQHLALNVDNLEDLLAMRDRIRSKGVQAFGPIHHGFCSSIYFGGPENLTLEISTSGGVEYPLDEGQWIDNEVVNIAGISPEELERYRNPPKFESKGGAVPQPPLDESKPRLYFPKEQYDMWLSMTDEELTKTMGGEAPPTVDA